MTLPGLEGWGGEALSEGDNRYRARIASCSGMASELWACVCVRMCVYKGRVGGKGWGMRLTPQWVLLPTAPSVPVMTTPKVL